MTPCPALTFPSQPLDYVLALVFVEATTFVVVYAGMELRAWWRRRRG